MNLHEVIAAKRDDVMRRWSAQVMGKIAPESMASSELANHLPRFLREIVAALREDVGLPSEGTRGALRGRGARVGGRGRSEGHHASPVDRERRQHPGRRAPRLVSSALGKLLRNGVKYSHAGGAVDVRGRVASGRVTIEVEDSCGGLPPGKVEEAFAPFVRLDPKQSGFGLGLAIAKQAVDAHGGSIRVQNLPQKGCIFVLELPAA